MRDLIAELRARPQAFDLFQALSLLERAEPDRAGVGTSIGIDEAVALTATTSLAFQPSDVNAASARPLPGPPHQLASPVMALAGASGPLPLPFTELLLERERRRDRAGLDLLDIFSQRMLGFLYRARSKHRPSLGAGSVDSTALAHVIDALSGLGWREGARGPAGVRSWLRHAGLHGAAPRSLASLLAMLGDRFGILFAARSFVGGWHSVGAGERAALQGRHVRGSRLGGDAVLGTRVWDQHGAIMLTAGPLKRSQFDELLPGGQSHVLLDWMARRHFQSDIDVHLEIGLARGEGGKAVLGGSHPARLGHVAWLGGVPDADGHSTSGGVVRIRTRQVEASSSAPLDVANQGERSGH